MDRRTLGGWLEGPGSGLPETDQAYRGERLGLPEQGPGAVASVGRRIAAISIDWFVAWLIAHLFASAPSSAFAWANLAVFAVMTVVLVWLTGTSLGHRLLGVQVLRLTGSGRVGLLPAVVRTVLLCLVVPALIWDRDLRGLHDKAAQTVVVRARPRGSATAA